MGFERAGKYLQNAVNFINGHFLQILPLSLMFFLAALTYSICWYAIDAYKEIACLNSNYIISFLFCELYFGFLGKEIIAVTMSSFSIIPIAALIYFVHKVVNNSEYNITESIKESIPGIIKIIVFRAGLTIIIFMPFLLFLFLGGDIIKERIIDTGRLTIEKMISWPLLLIPLTLFLGFTLLTLLYPVFQYVEYEVLILGARVRDAVSNSFSIAMKYKNETFLVGFLFIVIEYILLLVKLLYTVNPFLMFALLAAIFIESFLVFPLWVATLYFLWSSLRMGHQQEKKQHEAKVIKSYMDKMMLG